MCIRDSLGYDAADPIPLLQYVKKAAVTRQLDYIRTTKNACTVPTQNGYACLLYTSIGPR